MADTSANAELRITVKDQFSQPLKNAERQVGKLHEGLAQAIENATGFSLASVGLAGGVGAVGLAMKQSIDTTIKWGEEVDRFSRNMGVSSQEASRMLIVTQDLGIEQGHLQLAFKTMIQHGMQPSIETLRSMAAHYQSLSDPVARSEYAIKNFGRAGLQMTELLAMAPEKLDALVEAANRSGLVMSGPAVEGAKDFGIQLKQLDDQVKGLEVEVGGPLIGTLSKALTAGEQLAQIWEIGRIKLQLQRREITDTQAKLAELAVVGGDVYKAFGDVADASDRTTRRVQTLGIAVEDTGIIIGDSAIKINSLEEANWKLSVSETAVADGVSGNVRDAWKSYDDIVSKNKDTLAKYQDELAKLEAAQGEVVTVTKKASVTENEYELAIQKAAQAHKKLSDNTDPAKQLALAAAADQADQKVDSMSKKLGSSSDVIVNNAAKINDLKDKIDTLTSAQDAQAAAAEKATAQLIYQTIAAKEEPEVQLKLAEALGLLSQKDYDLATAALNLKEKYDSRKISQDNLADSAKYLAESFDPLKKSMDAGASSAANLTSYLSRIPTRIDVNVVTDYSSNYAPDTTPGHKSGPRQFGGLVSGGGSYVVGEQGPEIFRPSQSGTIVPTGGGGGDAETKMLLRQLPGMIALAVRDGIQVAMA